MMETALERSNGPAPQMERARPAGVQLSDEDVALLKATLLPPVTKHNSPRKGQPATDEELRLFVAQCSRSGLDPFSRQIEAVRYDGEKLSIGPSIHGLRLAAVRSGQYQGHLGPFWCGPDGDWRDVWLEAGEPAAARVGVRRAGCPEPAWGVATWAQSARTYFRDGKKVIMPRWQEAPADMLAKCAEAAALRKAFPIETAAFGSVVIEAPDSYAEAVDTETGEVIEVAGLREPAAEPTAPPAVPDEKARIKAAGDQVEAFAISLGVDTNDKKAFRAKTNLWMGRAEDCADKPTVEQWEAAARAAQMELMAKQAAPEAEGEEESPFEDGPEAQLPMGEAGKARGKAAVEAGARRRVSRNPRGSDGLVLT